MEEALLQFEIQVVELGDFKDVMYCLSMVLEVSVGSYAYIVHIDMDSGSEWFMFEDDVAVDVVHHGLKSCWQVGESKVHYSRFKKTVSGFEHRFLFISFMNAHVIVSPSNVKFGVYVRVAQISDEIGNQQEWVLVSNCDGVDLPVILYQSHFSVLFVNEEK